MNATATIDPNITMRELLEQLTHRNVWINCGRSVHADVNLKVHI